MTIAIDASRLLTKQPTGVELYCHEIINGLLAKSNNLILYTPKNIPNLASSNQQVLSWPFNFLWSQLRLGLELLIHPPQAFFSPGYVIPFLALFNKKTRKIVTIHDVAFIHLPQSYTPLNKWFLKLTTRQAVRHAHKIIVPTKATQDDLIKYFNCPKDKIELTYFGFQNKSTISHKSPRKKQILFIGRLETKKNIDNLVEAFKIFNQKHPDYKLILAGKPGLGFKPSWCQEPNVKCPGYISDQQKEQLLQDSSCLALISHSEGFGFPVLEGFSHQLPVLASAIPVLEEIGTNSCVFVNPSLVPDIAQGLGKITQDHNLRQQLINQGTSRLKDFSWHHCLQATREILSLD